MRKKKHKKAKQSTLYIHNKQTKIPNRHTGVLTHSHTYVYVYICAVKYTHTQTQDINAPTLNVLFSFCANLSTPLSSVVNYCKLLKKKQQTAKQKGTTIYGTAFPFYRVLFRFFTFVLSCLLSPIAIDNNTHHTRLRFSFSSSYSLTQTPRKAH